MSVRELAIDRSFDPLMLVEQWPERYPAYLESSAENASTGRFDLLPICDGRRIVLDRDGVVRDERGCVLGRNFAETLDTVWQRERVSAVQSKSEGQWPPFVGGWLLYLSYETAAQFEPSLHLPAFDRANAPIAVALRVPAVLGRERASGRYWLKAEPGYSQLLDDFRQDAAAAVMPANLTRDEEIGFEITGIDEDDPERFLAGVARIHDYLRAGDVFQVNLSRGWDVRFARAPSPTAVYRRLRGLSPAPFSGLLRFSDMTVASASPERLLRVRGRRIDTRPIAGTRPRGADASSDAQLRAELIAHPKERAEHVMLIDLERNDLGRICAPGSIHVDELMTLESYAHVHHIVSNVSGELRDGVTPGAVLRALFPGGTITGCPKVRCMEIIAELEKTGRGPYTGALGYLASNGDMDLNILIRSAWLEGDRLGFRAGAGIVADSVAVRELAETRAKAAGMLALLGTT